MELLMLVGVLVLMVSLSLFTIFSKEDFEQWLRKSNREEKSRKKL